MKFREHHWSMTFLFGWFWNTFYVSYYCMHDQMEIWCHRTWFSLLNSKNKHPCKVHENSRIRFLFIVHCYFTVEKETRREATKVRKYQRKTKSTKMTIVFKCKLQHIDCNSQCNKNYFVHKNVNLRQKKRVASREYKTKGHALCPLFFS